MGVLGKILATKIDEVTMLRRPQVRDLLRRRALDAPPARDFAQALRARSGQLSVIAEIKRRSPSKGDLAPDLNPADLASAYAAGGAACLSVLTDGPFFGGSIDDLERARAVVDLPLLRKDFVVDEIQVYETRALGADAILLIAAALPDDSVLRDLHELALGLGLTVLLETHDAAELDRAMAVGARLIGVNSRDLSSFTEDLTVAERLVQTLPGEVTAVAESAIRSAADAERMARAGFDAVLVGEALVRMTDPGELIGACVTYAVHRRV